MSACGRQLIFHQLELDQQQFFDTNGFGNVAVFAYCASTKMIAYSCKQANPEIMFISYPELVRCCIKKLRDRC